MEKTKQELLKEWSELWIPKFNELSQKYNTPYYTQSPLNVIETDIELMVVGINPKGNGKCTSTHTVDGYLEGNKEWWSKRFDKELKDSRFLPTDDCSLGMVPNTRTARLMMTRRWYGQIFLRLSHLKV